MKYKPFLFTQRQCRDTLRMYIDDREQCTPSLVCEQHSFTVIRQLSFSIQAFEYS